MNAYVAQLHARLSAKLPRWKMRLVFGRYSLSRLYDLLGDAPTDAEYELDGVHEFLDVLTVRRTTPNPWGGEEVTLTAAGRVQLLAAANWYVLEHDTRGVPRRHDGPVVPYGNEPR